MTSIGYSCTGKGPNSESLQTPLEGLTAPPRPPAVLRPELLAPTLFRNHLSTPPEDHIVYSKCEFKKR